MTYSEISSNPGSTHSRSNRVLEGSARFVGGGARFVGNQVNRVGDQVNRVGKLGVNTARGFWSDYRKFIDRGNVIDLAVGVVVGTAFTNIVNSIVNDLFTPILGLVTRRNFEELFATNTKEKYNTRAEALANGAVVIPYGRFLQVVINFIIVSVIVFFFVKAIEVLRRKPKPEVPEDKDCPYCMKTIHKLALRCEHCTTWISEQHETPGTGEAYELHEKGVGAGAVSASAY
ncbi:uncharacterized protein VTP21DRAFT_5698 [Calcarisporiella thermophila]|uniref:uncharacterized protein n=1 Tax=Calcarisporiella thermophila TaxID=911321 RepID=UPI0037435C6F